MNETALKLRGRSVAVDSLGRVCLNDIHRAGGFTVNQKPRDWGALESTKAFIAHAITQIAGKSGYLTKDDIKSAIYTKVGKSGGTWAHPIIALAYAKYLSPSLHYEVNEVFLRYKTADATLADEVLQRATPEENEWAAIRALSRGRRNQYTETLKDHGVAGYGYAQCTDATYKQLFDATAKSLKGARQLAVRANLRDAMPSEELVYVMAAETLATGRIQEEVSRGNRECVAATSRSAGFIRQAIEADRRDRKTPLL